MVKIKHKYAEQWTNSSEYFYLKGYYSWMETFTNNYPVIMEIGCGCGYSTLSLLEQGHKVLALDKNSYCIDKAYNFIKKKGFENNVAFLELDISQPGAEEEIAEKLKFDAVICWNMGSYYDLNELRTVYVPRMLEYGLTVNQINENVESSYCEYISWASCKLAAIKGVPFHLVDRAEEKITNENDGFYQQLGKEFGFSNLEYRSLECTSLSAGGVQLKSNVGLYTDFEVPIIFNSILFT